MKYTSTFAGINGELGEPFGIAVKAGEVYISDGQNGTIMRVNANSTTIFVSGLGTPSGIAFDRSGNLIVADSGTHTIKLINSNGEISTLAGIEGRAGFADGDIVTALFHAPVGLAVGDDGKIFVADTYNDRIRMIEKGQVSTLAGSDRGFANGIGASAKFDTPTGLAMWHDKLLVSDTGNRRIRVVEPDGSVATLSGSGEIDFKDGFLLSAAFVQPTALAVDTFGSIFVGDGNAIRMISGEIFPIVSTVSNGERGFTDGEIWRSRFNRPSGLAFDDAGNLLIADSDNRVIRRFSPERTGTDITPDQIAGFRDKPDEFRKLQPPRWPFDPPGAPREIAGTLGELRGEIKPGNNDIHFHNGLDIAGAYGETARFVRDEKVLRPIAAENFGTLRELIRLPTMGYIHIRLGRNSSGVPFNDPRFVFSKDSVGKIVDVRVPRGSAFIAGEPIGTLNAMNHVHLIAGRNGYEMNALDALTFPGLTDSRPPTIEKVMLFDENWRPVETLTKDSRIKLTGKTRIVVRAYDQADGNAERRRLGVYEVGYRIFHGDAPAGYSPKNGIKFGRMPATHCIKLVYADGSKSGATGETIFNYIATNFVDGGSCQEGFLDSSELESGIYNLQIFVSDYFGNITTKNVTFEVVK